MENIFESIDTLEKAYWLGMLFTDGCLKGNNIQLILGVKDKDLLIKFVKFLGDSPDKIKTYGPYKTSGVQVHYRQANKKMSQDLRKWGLIERKSRIIRLPNLDGDILKAFLMGCFDGDGCQQTTNICSGSELFLKDIKDKFNLPYEIKYKGTVYYLTLGANLFRELMSIYPNSLARKRLTRRPKGSYILNNNKNIIICNTCPICNDHKNITSKMCKQCWEKERLKNKLLKNICPICGEYKERHSKICINCYHNKCIRKELINKRKFNVSKEELDKLINVDKLTLIEIGKMFGVTDNAIKKRAKRLGIYHGRQKNYKNT